MDGEVSEVLVRALAGTRRVLEVIWHGFVVTAVPLGLTFSATYPHPLEAVWAAITDREALRTWFLENDFEPRLGQTFSVRGPHLGTVNCVVVALEPPRRMAWSWQSPDLPTPTRVVFTLEEVPDGTRLTIDHVGPAHAIHETDITRGWPNRLGRLDCWLASRSRTAP